VTNLRLMAGAEGSGVINGVERVGPPLQPELGMFDARALDGLDIILAEMARRDMKAVIFFSNNWEWSGGFQQYVDWRWLVPNDLKGRKLDWDELRDMVGRFYLCTECKSDYLRQVNYVMGRTNTVNRRKYTEDPTIMAWELANEPRPMWPAIRAEYKKWITTTAAAIKSRDQKHLVTIGHEGSIGTESLELFEDIHADRNVDYLTLHIWPKNWAWFAEGQLPGDFPMVVKRTEDYIREHIVVAKRLNKPLVIEEFGLPRDGMSFDPSSSTTLRDRYYTRIFSFIGGPVAGANFWAFGGRARPVKGQVFWKQGDDRMGDPPMEEQGLNTVFDSDGSTWVVIRKAGRRARRNE
ncbi:MAG TPA: cellulase family glycosylhydrolase, partial [Pyrinomonadaceae bacterium]|nr:cellulase family glycosylhydrolase [Pyrinomonadaceae bacterium]